MYSQMLCLNNWNVFYNPAEKDCSSGRRCGGQSFLRGFYGPLRYEPCTQFINVSQRTLHIYWQFSAMSHAIHKIVSKRRCQSYFISRRSPHHGISKDSDLCASAHRCPHYAYARLIARVNSTSQTSREGTPRVWCSRCNPRGSR